MEAALAAMDDSPASTSDSIPESDPTPALDASPDAAPVDVAPPPSDTGATPTPEPPKGPIPYDRHQAVLTNVRKEYEWLQKYGNAETAKQRLAVTEWMERDPVGFLRTYAANQGIDASALFPQSQPAAAPAPQVVDEMPQPDIPFENGQWGYSDKQTKELLAWQQRQMERKFEQEIAPIKQEHVLRQVSTQANAKATQQLQAARQSLPHFSEYEQEMAQVMAQAQAQGRYMTLHEAYAAVVPAKLAEAAKAAEDRGYQKALTEFQTKAGAASPPTPRAGGAPSQGRPTSIRAALEEALG